MTALFRKVLLPLTVAGALVSGCAATSSSSTSPEPDPSKERFANFLVIGVAGDYDSRAQFERMVVSELKAEGVTGRAYHIVAGGNKAPTREAVLAAIEENDFDAVVVTRTLDTESDVQVKSTVTGAKVTRKDEGFGKLFRYDYEEFDEPLSLTIDMKLTFGTELYSAASQSLVWSSETTGPKAENVGILIDETAESVVRQLKRAGKIAR